MNNAELDFRPRYDNDAKFRAHLAAQPVAERLFAWSRRTPALFAKNIGTQNFTVLEGMNFVKPEFAKVADPYIAVEAVMYQNGTVGRTLES